MPFREKIAWISLVTLVVIYGGYFAKIAKAAFAGAAPTFQFGGLLTGTIVTLVIVQIVLTAIVAARAPKDANAPADEREKLIDLKATNIAFYVLVTGAIAACMFVGLGKPAFYVANGLFFVVVLSEVVRTASRIYYYRAGV